MSGRRLLQLLYLPPFRISLFVPDALQFPGGFLADLLRRLVLVTHETFTSPWGTGGTSTGASSSLSQRRQYGHHGRSR